MSLPFAHWLKVRSVAALHDLRPCHGSLHSNQIAVLHLGQIIFLELPSWLRIVSQSGVGHQRLFGFRSAVTAR